MPSSGKVGVAEVVDQTFLNIKHYVVPAIRRISEQLLRDPDIQGKISLIVVDNSKNIESHEAGDAIVIPNKNLGGAGGFTRGFLHLKDHSFSHCLFMDDDASCEIESIRRTFRILQYAKLSKLAISGSMLREAVPHELFEAGAVFSKGQNIALKWGLDLRDVAHLLVAEENDVKPSYGGWWHFAFQISEVDRLAFPFFVRGDDILFSLLNNFDIKTMNGIGVWAEDFWIKESPLIRYLYFHAAAVISIVTGLGDDKDIIRNYRRSVRSALYSYNYSAAHAYSLALQHVIEGPDFWKANIDMQSVMRQIADECAGEKLGKINLDKKMVSPKRRENRLRRLKRRLTLNGFLLPNFLLRDDIVMGRKSYHGDHKQIYRHRKVAYFTPDMRSGYIAEHDKALFWKEVLFAVVTAWKFKRSFKKLQQQYAASCVELTSEDFWRRVYTE